MPIIQNVRQLCLRSRPGTELGLVTPIVPDQKLRATETTQKLADKSADALWYAKT